MFSIQAPTISGKAVFDACMPHTTDTTLIERLTRTSPSVAIAEQDFVEAVKAGDPSAYFKRARRPFACRPSELGDLYGRVLRDGGQRAIYDELIYAGKERPCPICGASIAGSLDHYLPVSSAPELSVVPMNLIPTCVPCNRDKRDHTPRTLDECLFNPFFDSWLDYPMLTARLVFEGGPRVEFDLKQPVGCPDSIYRRARKTFDVYKFAKNLPVAAATHFRSVKATCSFPFLLDQLRPVAIERWLKHQSEELSAKNPNDWQAAMYKAFANSERFLNGDYQLLPD
ncbi:5-methylcytosine-specific restriction endonuclease McrA [Rhizobium aethiopicum]|uniref:5-methylcytosine-specific restriction endonuclease McrA n=1 Tax=Rhizobium aethiopicum TaxID=1138170 RepID=A0A7W6MDW7_9HYPH|nr:HNH endonuclease signature motif containing protein [Rhizobium aethiopicum]MBB4190749.1 5-methylcytosine-specific restriction endonuclease McrA [Rhizobium aethiopicum]MBB4577938.1 5-methylcytosine-specific restriction endonuclease McrA [Rhizobium aethiopicum]